MLSFIIYFKIIEIDNFSVTLLIICIYIYIHIIYIFNIRDNKTNMHNIEKL